jgi:hypothetical protein
MSDYDYNDDNYIDDQYNSKPVRVNYSNKQQDEYDDYYDENEIDKQPYNSNYDTRSPSNGVRYEVRTLNGGILGFFDEDNKAKYKALVDSHDQKIYINDQYGQEFALIKRALVSIPHPKFSVMCQGRKVGKVTQRFKPARKKKFNYKDVERNMVYKIFGEEGVEFSVTKNNGHEPIANLSFMNKGTYSVNVEATGDDELPVICLLIICMAS